MKGLTDVPHITKAITPPGRIRVNIAFYIPVRHNKSRKS